MCILEILDVSYTLCSFHVYAAATIDTFGAYVFSFIK